MSKISEMTPEEAIPRIQLLQAMIASKNKEDKEYVFALQMGIKALQQPQIVRCKDCRFSILIPPCNQRKCNGAMEKIVSDDFFCADGERR